MKQIILLIFLITFSTFKISATCQDLKFKPSFSVSFDSTNGWALLAQCSRFVPKNIARFWTVSQDDIKNLENNFKNIYKISSKVCCSSGQKVDSLGKYAYQYVGIVRNANRYIYINAFPLEDILELEKSNRDLTRESRVVCDGGTDYWGVLFDIKRKQFIFLAFNGEA